MRISSISQNQNFGKLYVNLKAYNPKHMLFEQRNTQIKAVKEAMPELKEMAKDYDIFVDAHAQYNAYSHATKEADSVLRIKVTDLNDFFGRFIEKRHAKRYIWGNPTKEVLIQDVNTAIERLNYKKPKQVQSEKSFKYKG